MPADYLYWALTRGTVTTKTWNDPCVCLVPHVNGLEVGHIEFDHLPANLIAYLSTGDRVQVEIPLPGGPRLGTIRSGGESISFEF